jgi:CMP-N-acetylneuraminic acid synthetase
MIPKILALLPMNGNSDSVLLNKNFIGYCSTSPCKLTLDTLLVSKHIDMGFINKDSKIIKQDAKSNFGCEFIIHDLLKETLADLESMHKIIDVKSNPYFPITTKLLMTY